MANILCIANSSDEATLLGHYWMQRYAQYAEKRGHQVIFQNTPTLKVLYQALKDFNPQLVVANGHGGHKSLRVGNNVLIATAGYDKAVKKLIPDSDTSWFSGRIVILATCNAGTELVPALVRNGAIGAMGFKKPYIFLSRSDTDPQSDEVAKPFFETLYQPAIQLASGVNFQQAINYTRSAFQFYISETRDNETKRYLGFDLKNLTALGDPNARI